MKKKIFLIHGLGGTAEKTWGRFPKLLQGDEDLKDYEIYPLGYQSPPLWKFWKRAPSINNIANALLNEMELECNLRDDDIIVAGHSLGGAILKKILLILKDKGSSHNIHKICFFDTPHTGSGFANIGSLISIRNRHLRSLANNSEVLLDLSNQWSDARLNEGFEILNLTASNDDIVSTASSTGNYRDYTRTVNDTNHLSIVKPDSRESLSYRFFKDFILKKKKLIQYKTLHNGARSYKEWLEIDPRKHLPEFQNDVDREKIFQALVGELEGSSNTSIRLTGMSGLGKTRLLCEAIKKVKVDKENILIFIDNSRDREIEDLFREIIKDESEGLLIIENCSVDLHNRLMRDFHRVRSNLKLITVDYFHEQVDDSRHIKLEPLESNILERIIKNLLPHLEEETNRRLACFCEGNPLMAVLISEQYKAIDDNPILGTVSQESIIKKILEGNETISEDELSILRACSIFDVFAFDGNNANEFKYILEEVSQKKDINISEFIHKYSQRQVIKRVGNYARIVPKPIAVTLAANWWEMARKNDQERVFSGLPKSLRESFLSQIKYLEQHPEVKKFLNNLYGDDGPLGRAENLLTEQGSWFFRHLTKVNPKATSRALYKALINLSLEQLREVDGNQRRNLVWGLENLVFHKDCFLESGYSLLLLASQENEIFANNATGQFTQLYNVTLSGTEATPKLRFQLLEKGLSRNDEQIDLVILKALKNAINLDNNGRMVGAEYQGIRELQEWEPKAYEVIFQYIEKSLKYIERIITRGDQQKEKGLSILGESIRSLLRIGFPIDKLDEVIRRINGIDWPSVIDSNWLPVIDSINLILQYDLDMVPAEQQKLFRTTLKEWLELLDPKKGDLRQQLKMIVSLPNWEVVTVGEDRTGKGGEYRDLAMKKSISFAEVVAQSNIQKIIPHLNVLLYGEQRQTKVFGETLACQLKDERIEKLIQLSLAAIVKNTVNYNLAFVEGMLKGLFKTSSKRWNNEIKRIFEDISQAQFYPNFIRTGVITEQHLSLLLQLIESNTISPTQAKILSYGDVLKQTNIEDVLKFCLELKNISHGGAWNALSIIYMYLFGRRWDGFVEYVESLKEILLSVSLVDDNSSSGVIDFYKWDALAKKILDLKAVGDEKFVKDLLLKILNATELGIDFSVQLHYIKPILHKIIGRYPDDLWPVFVYPWEKYSGVEAFNFRQLCDRGRTTFSSEPSIFEVIPEETLIEWCKKNPKKNASLVASSISLFTTMKGGEKSEEDIKKWRHNPFSFEKEKNSSEKEPTKLFISILENFGDLIGVKRALYANLNSGVFSGSMVPYYEENKTLFQKMTNHANINVKEFSREMIQFIDNNIEQEKATEDENSFRNRR